MITEAQLNELMALLDACESAIADLNGYIDENNFEEIYNEGSEKQQGSQKGTFLCDLIDLRGQELNDSFGTLRSEIDSILEG